MISTDDLYHTIYIRETVTIQNSSSPEFRENERCSLVTALREVLDFIVAIVY